MNRGRLAAVPLVVLVILAAQSAAPASACACGAAAPLFGSEVDVGSEIAVVRWDGELEEIVMRLGMTSESGETGLVVPTPNPATVSAANASLFESLESAIEPRTVTEWDWWGAGPPDGAGGGAPPTVLDQVQLGPVEATTLAASDADGLSQWLDANGYQLAPEVTAELDPYIQDGWSFVALRLTSAVPFDGALDPIRFTFESDSLVYPMRMSRAADTPQVVRLYLLGEHRLTVTGTDGPLDSHASTAWAGPISGEVAELGRFLSVIDLFFPDPATQITGDLAITEAPNDDPVTPTNTVYRTVGLLGVPLGPLLVAVVVIAILFAVVLIGWARRTRSP